jgi:hypothetical protein
MPGWPLTVSAGGLIAASQAALVAVVAFLLGFLAGFLMAGYRVAGPQLLPLGRPGERPAGFGAAAGEPSRTRRRGNPPQTRTGDRRPSGRGRSTAAARPRPPRGPGAAGRRRPAPARSSGRPGRDGAAWAWSNRAPAWRSGRCAPGRTCERTHATPGPGPAASPRGRPTTATAPSADACAPGPAGPARGGWCRARWAAAHRCRGRGGAAAWGAAHPRRPRSRCRTGRRRW